MAQDLNRFRWALLIVVALAVALSGCSGAVRWNESPSSGRSAGAKAPARASRASARVPAQYTVKAGDSLYAIAHRYQLSTRDIATWNRLGSGELIFPGQVLRLTPPANSASSSPEASRGTSSTGTASRPKPAPTAPKTPPPTFIWPADGTLAGSDNDIEGVGEGIDIKGKIGAPVRAAAAGRVVYSGDGLIGYGNLLIVKHSERFLTAYGYNKTLLVKEGDSVARGQTIASMGRAPDRSVRLHFEIRDNGKPVDPAAYLPPRRR